MGAGQLALERVAVGPVALLAGAGDLGDGAGGEVDRANRVGFGVGEVEALGVGGEGEALGAGEGGELRGAVVAGGALLAGAGEVVEGLSFRVEAEDLIALAEG